MAESGAREEQQRALRIVSKCSSVDEFVSIFRRFCDHSSLFIVTQKPKPLGTKSSFAITLANGEAMLKGSGTVVESYPDKHNSFGRPGMKLRFEEMDAHSRQVLDRLNQAKKAKKHTPPPLPRHMRARSEGEEVPPASPELSGFADSDALDDEDNETQVDDAPGADAAAPTAKEERRKGSDFVLPANPFGELTDASLEAFVECTLYEETGALDIGLGQMPGSGDEVSDALAAASADEEAGAGEEATAVDDAPVSDSQASNPRAALRPVTVPAVIPPVREPTPPASRQEAPATPDRPGTPAAPSAGVVAAAAPGQPRLATPAPGAIVVPAASVPAPATPVPGSIPMLAQPSDLTPLPGETTDITPMPLPPGVGAGPAAMDAYELGVPARRTWGARALVLAGGATLLLGLVIGYLLWGMGAEPGSAAKSAQAAGGAASDDTGAATKTRTVAVSDAAASGAVAESLDASAPAGDDPGTPDLDAADAGDSSAAAASRSASDPGTAPSDSGAGGGECVLELVTVPDGAQVRAGADKLGVTPYSGEMPCDAAALTIRHPRYVPVTRSVAPVPGEATELTVTLQRPTLKLRVTSSPKGATVTVGGRRVGTTPVTTKVQGFVYTNVNVSKSGYKSFATRVYPKRPVTSISAKLTSTKKPSTKRKPKRGTR